MNRKALTVVLPVVLAGGAVFGFASSSGGEATPDLTKDPTPVTAKALVAQGKTDRGDYEVRGYRNEKDEVCFDITYEADQPAHYGCGSAGGPGSPLGLTVISAAPGGGKIVYGSAAADVASVDVEVPGHGHVHSVTKAVAGVGRVFSVRTEGARGITVTAEDSEGRPVAGAPRPQGGPPTNSVGGEPGDG